MWSNIEEYFKGCPKQKEVARLLFQRGFRISNAGRVMCGKISIPHTQIAKELGFDMRVVDTTVYRILENKELEKIYKGLQSIAFLRDIAPDLGLGVIVVSVMDASKPGIIGSVGNKIAEYGMVIRQAIADDPYITESPKFTVITGSEIPGKLIEDLRKIEGVKNITVY
jgi:hypothetical protein